MPSRDYVLRLIEQVGQFLARVIRQRDENKPQEALQSVMAACERLFGMEAARIFQLTPEQQIALLTDGEPWEEGREKLVMYAALNAEAAACFEQTAQPLFARQSRINALRLLVQAHGPEFPGEAWPSFAPKPQALLHAIGPLPAEDPNAEIVNDARRIFADQPNSSP